MIYYLIQILMYYSALIFKNYYYDLFVDYCNNNNEDEIKKLFCEKRITTAKALSYKNQNNINGFEILCKNDHIKTIQSLLDFELGYDYMLTFNDLQSLSLCSIESLEYLNEHNILGDCFYKNKPKHCARTIFAIACIKGDIDYIKKLMNEKYVIRQSFYDSKTKKYVHCKNTIHYKDLCSNDKYNEVVKFLKPYQYDDDLPFFGFKEKLYL